jgi:predicted RNA binding protein YcfA (HicA-like mRNA interferase family)
LVPSSNLVAATIPLHQIFYFQIAVKNNIIDVGMKVRDVIKLIEAHGWYLVDTKGSHRQYKHQSKPGRVTIAGKPNDDLAPGTLNSILKQAELKEER